MAAFVAWIWDHSGTSSVHAFLDFVSLAITAAGGGGLWPLWKWALRPDDSAGADADSRARAERRRRLAGNIRRQLVDTYGQGEWSDEQYAELKAEFHVDAILPDDVSWWQSLLGRDTLVRRERSLTRAMLGMRPRVVILEGEPGSGKSVALRHLALWLARRASTKGGPGSLLPVYINLKDFRPAAGRVDSESVRAFIYDTLVSQDRGIAGFLDAEFDDTLRAGSWLLLFDSFDEIPAVLGATEADEAVREYAKAIIDFTENRGFRAVIASREFRGPRGFPLPRLRIVRLTSRQQRTLIRRSGLPPDMAAMAVAAITRAGPDLRQLTDNPLFLWLVCQYLRDNDGMFPESSYAVFDSYVRHRLTADETRLREIFGVEAAMVRSYAEQFAFSMASSPDLGLTPAAGQLAESVSTLPTTSPLQAGRVPPVLEALVYLKLGRYETSPGEPDVTRFSFTHRRLQEYFATCAAFSRAEDLSPRTLLTDGHWRETAVATFQTRPAAATRPLLAALREMLAPLAEQALQSAEPFTWPPVFLHLLDVLAAGLGRAPERIPGDIRELAGQVLTRAWDKGSRYDKLWATDVARVAPGPVTDDLLTRAFNSPSRLLQEAALQQAAWLEQVPPAAESGLRRLLVSLWASGDLAGRSRVLRVQLGRFRQATTLLAALRLLRSVMLVDFLLLTLLALVAVYVLRALGYGLLGEVLLPAWILTLPGLRVERAMFGTAAASPPPTRRRHGRTPGLPVWGTLLRLVFPLALVQMALIRATSGPGMPVGADVPYLFAVVYELGWPNAAVSSVLAGDAVPIWTWPLLPARRAARLAVAILRALSKRKRQTIVTATGFGIYVGLSLRYPQWMSAAAANPQSIAGLTVVLVVSATAGLLAILVIGGRRLSNRLRLRKRRREILREARSRTAPYEAAEIAAALGAIRTTAAVKELAETLRLTPALCPPDVIGLFSDLLNAAERYDREAEVRRRRRGVLTRRPPQVLVHPGSGPAFTAWAEENPVQLNELLRALDEETLDEITRLIVACRTP
jgi:NACHT domain-containing protein